MVDHNEVASDVHLYRCLLKWTRETRISAVQTRLAALPSIAAAKGGRTITSLSTRSSRCTPRLCSFICRCSDSSDTTKLCTHVSGSYPFTAGAQRAAETKVPPASGAGTGMAPNERSKCPTRWLSWVSSATSSVSITSQRMRTAGDGEKRDGLVRNETALHVEQTRTNLIAGALDI